MTKPATKATKVTKAPATKAVKATKKPTRKAAQKKATKPAKAVEAKEAKSAPVKHAKKDSPKAPAKVKLVRDSFTLPEADHDLIKQCKKTAIAAGRETKKSEVVRAAIRVFSELAATQQLAAYGELQSIAVGRPKSK